MFKNSQTDTNGMPESVARRLRSMFPEHDFAYAGRSGTTLLAEALSQDARKIAVLPAFICSHLSMMARVAGKQLVLIDDPTPRFGMALDRLRQFVATQDAANAAVLVDHTFGYPCQGLRELKRDYPRLLIIEDCVRALGAEVEGSPVGRVGDWVLLSLHKCTPGNDHGAVLLTREPYAVSSGAAPPVTWRQRLSTWGPSRLLYERWKRRRPDFPPVRTDITTLRWSPTVGVPHRLAWRRFDRQLTGLDEDRRHALRGAEELRDALDDFPKVRCMPVEAGAAPAANFLSFLVREDVDRDRMLHDLHRRGFFLLRTWDQVPACFRCFADCFPFGIGGSVTLAERIAHIPLWEYRTPGRRRRLVETVAELLSQSERPARSPSRSGLLGGAPCR